MECNNLFYKDIYAKELKYNYFDMAILLVTSKVFNTDKKKKLRENLSYWSSNIDGYKIYPTYSECKNFFESTKKLSINQEVKDKTQILNQNNSKELGHKNQKVNKKKKEKREIKPYDLSTLPPEPDAELVKTEFVDVNGNKVRDDIEIAVAKKFQRDADLVEAYFADSRTLEYELYLARNKIFDKGSIEQSLKNMHYTMDCNYLLYEDVYEKELEWDAFEMSRILLGPRVYNTDEKEKLIDDFYRMQDGYVHTDEPTYSECKEFFESTKDLLVKKEKRAIKPYDLSKLPPKPDSKLVKTKFVDVNKNKIRDDIEIFIAKKFQEDADLVESFFARTRVLEHQLYLARNKMLDKKNIRKDTERITYATRCNYLLYEDLYDDKLAWDVSRLFEDSVFYKIFNTDEKRNLKDEFSFAYDDFSDDFTEVWFTPTYSRCKEFFESTKNLPVGG
ncbi:hypothetical protein CSB11_00945 [Candidatus Campbellbacteria bacterium]|nr:MAG: hypothetical protein CSB11_00945 [Candidatus Campbellbacteria bacterium]